MSWDRDEAANQQEALDRLTESQRELADTLREYFSRDRGDGYGSPPRGGDGEGADFDVRGITEFNQAMRDSVGPIRVFARSLDMLSEKLEEALVQARDLQQAGSFNPQPKPNPQQAAQLPGQGQGGAAAPLAFPTSPLFRPTSYMIPNQYGGFTTYSMGGAAAPAAQPITVPATALNPGQVRRRQARRRAMMRRYNQRKAAANRWRGIARGAYYGGIFGGVKGAFRGAAAGVIRGAMNSKYAVAAGLVAAMPFMMSATAAASERQLDTNRAFSVGAPETMKALVQYDVNGFMRNMQMAQATSTTAVNLIRAQDYERTQQMPFDVMSRNVANTSAGFFSNMAGRFFESTKGIWDGINNFATDQGVQEGAGAAGRVAGDAAAGAFIGGAIGLLTIPFLGWFGPALGAAAGSAIAGWGAVGKEIGGGFGRPERGGGVNGVAGDGGFLDQRFAPKPRKI